MHYFKQRTLVLGLRNEIRECHVMELIKYKAYF